MLHASGGGQPRSNAEDFLHIYSRKLKPRIATRRQHGIIPAVEKFANAFEPARGHIKDSANFSPEDIAKLSTHDATIEYATTDAEHVDLDSCLAIGGSEIPRLKVDICHRLGKWAHNRQRWCSFFTADSNLVNEAVFESYSEFDNISQQISDWHASHRDDLQKIADNPPTGFTRDIDLVTLIAKVELWSQDHMLVFAFYVGWVVSFGWLRASADASLPGIRAGGARAGAKAAAPGRRLRGLVGC